MATIGALPLCCGVPPWVNDEDLRCFSQVEGHAAGFEGDEEALDVDIGHEVVDGGLALGRGHRAVKHDGCDACAAETPFNKLKHGRELAEDDGFAGHVFGAKFVEVVNQSLDLRAGRPVLHLDSVDD